MARCRYWFRCLVPACFLAALLSVSSAAGESLSAESADITAREVRSLVQQGEFSQALSLLAPYADQPDQFPTLYSDYLVILTWAGRADEALTRFEALPETFPRRPYLLRNMAKAYLDGGRSERASALYAETVAQDPGDPIAQEGWMQAQGRMAQPPSASFEPQDGWEAVLRFPYPAPGRANDQTAIARMIELSGLGATSVAQTMAERMLPPENELRDRLRQDAAVARIRWEEYPEAVDRLAALETRDQRYGFDYVVALFKAGRNPETIEAYERLEASGADPPDRTRLAAAGAFLAEKQPAKALDLYNQALASRPQPWEARAGKLYALQTLRRWNEADAWLEQLHAEIPPVVAAGGRSSPNPEKFQLDALQAWYLAHQNRTRDAEAAFRALQAQAPADLEARNGLAHVHLWRGRPRQALEEFDILHTLAPDYEPAVTGRAMALNTLAEKEQARELAADLLRKNPLGTHARQTWRALQVEQMKEWRTEIYARREDSDADDLRIRTELSAPLSLKTRLFGYLLWRRTYFEDAAPNASAYFRRAGAGIDHIVNADWRLRPEISFNYDDGKDPGAALHIDYTPTDRWSFGAFGDSFSTAVDGRARSAGIEAAAFGASAVWRPSEWRQAGVWYTRSHYSDDNDRDELALGYEQNLWARHDWRLRGFLNLYAARNSLGDRTVYFNPERAEAGSVTLMIEQTVWDMYPQSFLHRLYLTGGVYRQHGCGAKPVGALRYEQLHAFSDRHALQAGVSLGHNVYDGETVTDLRFDMVYQWRF
jgi:tetratricopeptide (TPR) repeat protein